MMPLINPLTEVECETEGPNSSRGAVALACNSLTIFTHYWKDVRNFYVEILGAKILAERGDRQCDVELGELPLSIRRCENGEAMSYFHLHLTMQARTAVLNKLRRRGIIVTVVGGDAVFRDPEGRVIKLSESKRVAS